MIRPRVSQGTRVRVSHHGARVRGCAGVGV